MKYMKMERILLSVIDNFVWILILIVFAIFSVLISEYSSPQTIFAILQYSAVIGPLALGLAVCVLAGDFDISVSQIAGLGTVAVAWLVEYTDLPWFVVILVPFAIGIVAGGLQGYVIGRIGANPFLVTLAGWIIFRSIKYYFSGGYYYNVKTPEILFLGMARIEGGLFVNTILFILLAIILWIFLKYTRLGSWIYAVGGSAETSRRLGVNPGNVKLLVHLLAGLIVGFSGIFYVGQIAGYVQPTAGEWDIFKAFIAIAIAGIDINGGRGSIINVLGGVIFYSTVLFGAQMMNIPWPFSEYILPGGLTLIAVVLLNRLDILRDRVIARTIPR